MFSLIFSCKRAVHLEKNEHLLYSQAFKGNKTVLTNELETLIPPNQKPNTRLLSLPSLTPAVWWYNFGLTVYNDKAREKRVNKLTKRLANLPSDSVFYDAVIARKKIRINEKLANIEETRKAKIAWIFRNTGAEPTTKISDEDIKKTAKNMQAYLSRRGYQDALVKPLTDSTINHEIRLTYEITENEVYKIDTVIYALNKPVMDSLVKKNLPLALIKAHDKYDEDEIISERIRLENLFKNNGYYLFDKQFIAIKNQKTEEDFQKSKRATIKFTLKDDSDRPQLQQYHLETIEFTAVDANAATKVSAIDTTVQFKNGIKYILIQKQLPIRLLDSRITLRPSKLYSQNDVIETQRQLSILDQFAFANTRFSATSNGKLKAIITAPTLEKYFVTADINGNTIQDIFGGGVSGTLRIRNLMHSLDNLEIGLRFSLEGQPSAINKGNALSKEYGATVSLNFPEIIFPYRIAKKLALKNPKTQLSLGANYSSQIYRETLNFRFTGSYSWRKSAYETIQILPIDMNLINTPYKDSLFVVALNQEPTLKELYKPQFVSSINASYVFNNQVLGQNKRARYLRFFIESGGTSLNLFKEKDQINFLDKLISVGKDTTGRSYYRFWKINVDYRRFFPITRNSSWAYKVNVGISQSYGKISIMPYQKSFFAGGSNSLRAWSPRSLGPGSSSPEILETSVSRYLPQPGDILLESSIEYRTKMFRFFVGDMNLGVFVDAGNVWRWYQVPNKLDKANFDFSRFYKEIAVGTGLGFRWDLSYFIIRYDLGIKVIDPSQPVGQRWVLNKFNSNDYDKYYKIQSNFAIGLPF